MLEPAIEKIAQMRKYCEINGIDIDLEVDGGVTLDNVAMLVEKGANMIVAGTAILSSKDYAKAIETIKKA